jgi:hypothetical protein
MADATRPAERAPVTKVAAAARANRRRTDLGIRRVYKLGAAQNNCQQCNCA